MNLRYRRGTDRRTLRGEQRKENRNSQDKDTSENVPGQISERPVIQRKWFFICDVQF